MSSWRAAGLNYIQYSNIAAKVLRQSLKSNLKTEALKREESHVRFTPWKDGKPIKSAKPIQESTS
ncbi:protein stunted isoform X1 [Halyomorpha halys]|uniref:protein stunted isoform X1 n=1 Tax=Halyomorpha halys TaxID=286706 RepID=UPI0006D52463|nr:protein stunted isoform X1 [Halyomorpha halys]